MYLTGARIAPPSKKKLFTERNLYLLLHNFGNKVFILHISAQLFYAQRKSNGLGFFLQTGLGGSPLSGGGTPPASMMSGTGRWVSSAVSTR
jgi:hypothetical protein